MIYILIFTICMHDRDKGNLLKDRNSNINITLIFYDIDSQNYLLISY